MSEGVLNTNTTGLAAPADQRAPAVSGGVLRADTAACAALTLWQATLGDWR